MKLKFLIPLIAGLGLLCACKGKNGSETTDSTKMELSSAKNMVKKADTAQADAKLIKTADINFEVKSVQQTAEHVAALTTSLNGMVIHHVMGSLPGHTEDIRISNDSILRVTAYTTTAQMTVKIPPSKMEDFVNQVARMGIQINNLKMNIEDKSLDYLSAGLKLKNKMETGRQNQTSNDAAGFKDDLVDRQLGNRKIDDSVKNSIISLSFYESNVIKKQTIANDDLKAYTPSVYKRIGIALESGWEMFMEVVAGIAYMWVLVPLGAGAWVLIKYYKRKRLVRAVHGS